MNVNPLHIALGCAFKKCSKNEILVALSSVIVLKAKQGKTGK